MINSFHIFSSFARSFSDTTLESMSLSSPVDTPTTELSGPVPKAEIRTTSVPESLASILPGCSGFHQGED